MNLAPPSVKILGLINFIACEVTVLGTSGSGSEMSNASKLCAGLGCIFVLKAIWLVFVCRFFR